MTLGEKIKLTRKAKHMTQETLGQAIGVSKRTVCLWEKNETTPRTKKMYQQLAQKLDVNLNYLLTDDMAFVTDSGDTHGYRGKFNASDLMTEVNGLFSSGDLKEDDMDLFMFGVQMAYVDAKRRLAAERRAAEAERIDG